MSEHRYILEKYTGQKSRYDCPGCGEKKEFARYIDTETGEHLAPSVGICNRVNNCGYHYKPGQYFKDNGDKTGEFRHTYAHARTRANCSQNSIQKPLSLIPIGVFKASLKSHEGNNFVKFLIELFGSKIAGELVSRYFIGSSKHWPGSTVFWQIDTQGKIRAGKIMLYSPFTGKRVKEPVNHITWVHTALKLPSFELKQALYGEHLLKVDPGKPCALVESEKTAIIASIYLPQFIWLATGSLNTLNAKKCQVLTGRAVVLFPDLKGFDKWTEKAEEIEKLIPGIRFVLSDLLETKASSEEKAKGLDLADYLIRFDWQMFRKEGKEDFNTTVNNGEKRERNAKILPIKEARNGIETVKRIESLKSLPDHSARAREAQEYSNICLRVEQVNLWDISGLQLFFQTATLPTDPVKLDQCTTILNVRNMVSSHFETVKAQNGNPRYLPYLLRLELLKQILSPSNIN